MKQIMVGVALILFAGLVLAKPKEIENSQVKNDKIAIAELGNYAALTNAIMTATKVDDLRPILLKIVGASYSTEAGKDKKAKK
jgi:hypothetical protein